MFPIAQNIATIFFLLAICIAAPSYSLSPAAAKIMGQNYDRLVECDYYMQKRDQPGAYQPLIHTIRRYKASLQHAIAHFKPGYSSRQIDQLIAKRERRIIRHAANQLQRLGCDSKPAFEAQPNAHVQIALAVR